MLGIGLMITSAFIFAGVNMETNNFSIQALSTDYSYETIFDETIDSRNAGAMAAIMTIHSYYGSLVDLIQNGSLGHSWLVFQNVTGQDITVGRRILPGGATVSVGTWGNLNQHISTTNAQNIIVIASPKLPLPNIL